MFKKIKYMVIGRLNLLNKVFFGQDLIKSGEEDTKQEK